MSDSKDKYKEVNDKLQKREAPVPARLPVATPEIALGGRSPSTGIRERIKRDRFLREARLEALQIETSGRLKSFKDHVDSQTRLAIKRIEVDFKSELEVIVGDHLENLREIGIRNFEGRSRALRQLVLAWGVQYEQNLAIEGPDKMKQMLQNNLLESYEDLFERISSDEISAPRHDGE